MAGWFKTISDRLRMLRPTPHLIDISQCYELAINLARKGYAQESVHRLTESVEQLRRTQGGESPEFGNALFTLAKLHVALGNHEMAGTLCFRAARTGESAIDHAATRLTYLMNAGELWLRCGRLGEAIELLRRGLADRIELYGKNHEGVAYGQVALAQAFMAAGQFERGEFHADDARRIFASKQHPALPNATALVAAFQSVHSGRVSDALSDVCHSPAQFLQQFLVSCNAVAAIMPGSRGLEFLERVAHWAADELVTTTAESGAPVKRGVVSNAVGIWSNFAVTQQDSSASLRAAELAIEICRKLADDSGLVDELSRYAATLSRFPDNEDRVRAVYEEAYLISRNRGLFNQAARLLRNYALFESEQRHVRRANELFQMAMDSAEWSQSSEIRNRIQVAHGVFLHHLGQNPAATPLLRAGTEGLDPTHADAMCGRLHLAAIELGLPCPCSESESLSLEGLTKLSRQLFDACGLAEVVESVRWVRQEELELMVSLRRKPVGSEIDILQVAFHQLTELVRGDKPQVSEV